MMMTTNETNTKPTVLGQSSVPDIEEKEFTTAFVAADNGRRFNIVFSGSADMRVWEKLRVYFRRMHEAAVAQHVRNVSLDLRKLSFMNSSCFKSLVGWMADLRDLPPDQQYQVRILSDPEQHWQRRSLTALPALAEGLVTIVTPER